MRGSEEFYSHPTETSDWIYIGGDIYNRSWAKIGKTTNPLDTRHRSSQNPGFFIYAAFNLTRGDVHEMESRLLTHLSAQPEIIRFAHFSTGSPSECFKLNPEIMTYLVESFLEEYFGSCFDYDTLTSSRISRYLCRNDIRSYYNQTNHYMHPSTIQLNKLRGSDYFTGNQEIYETDLGGGLYLDISSGEIKHVSD